MVELFYIFGKWISFIRSEGYSEEIKKPFLIFVTSLYVYICDIFGWRFVVSFVLLHVGCIIHFNIFSGNLHYLENAIFEYTETNHLCNVNGETNYLKFVPEKNIAVVISGCQKSTAWFKPKSGLHDTIGHIYGSYFGICNQVNIHKEILP